MGIIALAAFWVAAIMVWSFLGPKVPLIFIALWLLAFFGFRYFGVSGYFFVAFEAILAAILLVILKYE